MTRMEHMMMEGRMARMEKSNLKINIQVDLITTMELMMEGRMARMEKSNLKINIQVGLCVWPLPLAS